MCTLLVTQISKKIVITNVNTSAVCPERYRHSQKAPRINMASPIYQQELKESESAADQSTCRDRRLWKYFGGVLKEQT